MSFNVKQILKDKNVLRVVTFLAILNVIGYLMVQNIDAVAFFALVGFLTTYFSKNMIIVLMVAILATNTFVMVVNSKEGFNGKGSRKGTRKMKDSTLTVTPASNAEDQEMSTGHPGDLDKAATVEKAYENLETMLGGDAIKKMGTDTQNLAKRQQKLQKQIETLQPALNQSFQLLDQMGGPKGVEGMIEKVGGMIEKFGGLTGGLMKK